MARFHSGKDILSSVILFIFVCGNIPISFGQEPVELGVTGIWPKAAEMAGNCAKRWSELSSLYVKLDEAAKKNDFSKMNLLELGKAYGKSQLTFMESSALRQVFETAGLDHDFRQRNLRTLIERAVMNLAETKEAKALSVKASQRKKSTDAKRDKEIANIFKLWGKKDYEAAEKGLMDLNSDVDTFYLFLSPAEKESVTNQIKKVNLEVGASLAMHREKKSKEMAIQTMRDLKLDVAKLIKDVDSVQLEIRSSGSAQLNGSEMTGSKAFEELLNSWMMTRLGIMKASGISIHAGNTWFPEYGQAIKTDANVSSWKSADSELSRKMSSGLVQIINSTASRIAISDIPKQHQAFVAAIARFSSQVKDPKWVQDCETALMSLARKDPAYASRVDQYRMATSDLLKWRAKIAISRAKATETKYPDLYPQLGEQSLLPYLAAMLPEAIVPFRSQTGVYCRFNGITGNSEKHFGSIDRGLRCSFSRLSLDQRKALEDDLFVTAGVLPLSVEAAFAKFSVDAGVYESAGGQVKTCLPHGMATYFARMDDDSHPGLVNEFPTRVEDMLVEVALKPEWIQHKYFFAEIK